ncbi:MAG: 6-phosphogluconolactonase, partial [Verrucomicrobiales bacterium]
MTRSDEIRELLSLSPVAVREKAGKHLLVLADIDALHRHCADSIADEIVSNNRAGRATKLVLPVGPVGQYPILAQRVNEEKISLENCWFLMMDEHCDEEGIAFGPEHPLGFRHTFEKEFTRHVAVDLMVPACQVIFPDQHNVEGLVEKIASLGGIDTTYGGIGIHGHVAFNEPEPGVRESDPRVVLLNEFTRTINAVRSQVGG